MAYHAAVPLDSAREPGVSYREIAETDNIVFIYYIFLVPLVIERPQSAAEGRQELAYISSFSSTATVTSRSRSSE